MFTNTADTTAPGAGPLKGHPPLKPHQEWDAGENCPIGRNPRQMTTAELEALGRQRVPALRTIRLKCLDCCAGNAAEVRRRGMLDCPSWPYRMGTDPWRAPLSEEQRETRREIARRVGFSRVQPVALTGQTEEAPHGGVDTPEGTVAPHTRTPSGAAAARETVDPQPGPSDREAV